MIILGNKYQITKQEEKEITQKVKNIHYLDINNEEIIIKELKKFLDDNDIEFIVLNLEKDLSFRVKSYLEELDYDGIKIMLFKDFAKSFFDREIIVFNENNLLAIQSIKHNKSNILLKRYFDIGFSLCALVGLFPVFVIIAILIKIKSPNGPIFFTQQRLGLNKTFFRVIKFRTMIPNAEKVLKEMMEKDEELRDEYLTYRKLKNDPRIIPGIGEFLRKTSLDELPQFFNILIGDMSVVGPRPYIEDEFYSHDSKFLDVILSVRPGITGPWQVGERSDTTFNQRVFEDVKYISTQSLLLDLKIIIKTVQVMIFRQGAY
jgi:lipopolysaccharide/colanic/teichoic acid biosynthesis glycosyltransferase